MHVRRIILIALLSAFATLAGVFTMPVLDADEARYAQASAQMLHSGDYLHIRFLDKARNAKPAGIYWMQAASVSVFDQLDNRAIWAWRLPSVLGAMLAALAAFWAGCVLVGHRAAFWGALLLAPSLLLASEGGIAKTDAMQVGLITIMMAALAHLRHGGHKSLALVFWVALGAAVLVKGPAAPLIAAFALIVLWRWEGKAAWMRPLRFWPGPILALLIVGPWLVMMQMGTQGAFLKEAIGGDLLPKLWQGKEGHFGLPGQHFLSLPLMLFPASIFLPLGLAGLWQARKEHTQSGADWRFLLVWIIPWWGIVELMPTKLVHYPLPVFPALALVAGLGVVAPSKLRWPTWAGGVLILLAPLAVMVLLLALLRSIELGDGAADRLVVLTFVLIFMLVVAGLWTLLRGKNTLAVVLGIGVALVLHIGIRGVLLPSLTALSPSSSLVILLKNNDLLPGQSAYRGPVAAAGLALPSLVFLSRGSVWYASPKEAAQAFMDGQAVLIEDRQQAAFKSALGAPQLDGVTQGAVRGYNYTKGQAVRVDLLVPQKDITRHASPH